MGIRDLTNEQIEKINKCKTAEERQAFYDEYKNELSEEELNSISGGDGRWFYSDDTDIAVCERCKVYTPDLRETFKCPICKKSMTKIIKAKDLPDDYNNINWAQYLSYFD